MSLDLNLQVHPLDAVLSVLTTLPCCPPVEICLAFHRSVVCLFCFQSPSLCITPVNRKTTTEGTERRRDVLPQKYLRNVVVHRRMCMSDLLFLLSVLGRDLHRDNTNIGYLLVAYLYLYLV